MTRSLVLALALLGCTRDPAPPAPSGALRPGPAPAATRDAATAPADSCARAQVEGRGGLPWIHDDLPSALACARLRKVPVVVDLWAPWCHTCLSVQNTVLTDPSFQPDAERFVFAALDTDREVNADAVARLPQTVWPTFYVISSAPAPGDAGDRADRGAPAVLARFAGGVTVAQFHALLEAGVKAALGGADGADAKLLDAERALAARDLVGAERALTAALAQAPTSWPRRADALTSLVATKRRRKDVAGCLELADKALDDTGLTAAATDFVAHALACAAEAKASGKADAKLARWRDRAAARLRKIIDDPASPMSIDDRSDAMDTIRELDQAAGRTADATAISERQRAMLDRAAAEAPTPIAAMTYNWHRCEVYEFLQRPLELVPALEKSARDLPTEYDPRYRLGWLYYHAYLQADARADKPTPEQARAKATALMQAARWTDEALRLVYGPRKAKVLGLRADIADRQGNPAARRMLLQEIVRLWDSLPPGQANPEAREEARKALEAAEAAEAHAAKP